MFSFVDKCSLRISFGWKYDRSKLDLGDMGVDNGWSVYNRKTHKVHQETLVKPDRNLQLEIQPLFTGRSSHCLLGEWQKKSHRS